MISQDRIRIAREGIQIAYERLKSASDNLSLGNLRDVVHSSYYAAYTAIRVLLNLEYDEQRKHYGNISKFRELYVKTDVFDRKLSKYIDELFSYRDIGDYDLSYVIDFSTAEYTVNISREFVDTVHEYLVTTYFGD